MRGLLRGWVPAVAVVDEFAVRMQAMAIWALSGGAVVGVAAELSEVR